VESREEFIYGERGVEHVDADDCGSVDRDAFDVALIAAPVVYVDGSWLIRLQSAAEAQRQWALADAALHEVESRMSLASGCAP